MNKLITHFCDFIFGKHKNNSLPRIWILLVDMVIVAVSFVLAILMFYARGITNTEIHWLDIVSVVVIYLVAFLITKTYDGMLRYSGFNDVRKILYSCTGAVVVLLLFKLLFSYLKFDEISDVFPHFSIIVYHYLITMVLMVIMRLTIRRLYNEIYKSPVRKENTIIYGAGDGGTILFRTLSQDTASVYNVKAFVDDNQKRVGLQDRKSVV